MSHRHDDQRPLAWRLTLAALMLSSAMPTRAWSAPELYWCPDRPADRLYSTMPEPGCRPLVESHEQDALTPPPSFESAVLLSEASLFLERYRWFLECCATDVASIEEVEDLERHATRLLRAIPPDLLVRLMRVRGITLTAIVTPVARARDELRQIRQRLEQLRAVEERLATHDFYTVWRERRRMREEVESFVQGLHRPRLPAGPPTGTEIGATPPHGPEIGVVPPTGPEIGTVPPTGREIGTVPPTGKEIGQTPPTGFEIGTTGRVGPDIGEADQQRQGR